MSDGQGCFLSVQIVLEPGVIQDVLAAGSHLQLLELLSLCSNYLIQVSFTALPHTGDLHNTLIQVTYTTLPHTGDLQMFSLGLYPPLRFKRVGLTQYYIARI